MSYLLFDATYTRTLVEIGYEDAAKRCAELEAFVREAAPPPATRPARALRSAASFSSAAPPS